MIPKSVQRFSDKIMLKQEAAQGRVRPPEAHLWEE